MSGPASDAREISHEKNVRPFLLVSLIHLPLPVRYPRFIRVIRVPQAVSVFPPAVSAFIRGILAQCPVRSTVLPEKFSVVTSLFASRERT